MEDAVEVTEANWILHDMVANTNLLFDTIQEKIQKKEKDPLLIKQIQEELNREEQINLFIEFIQVFEEFQRRFCKVQAESIAIRNMIDQLKPQQSDLQDPLPGNRVWFLIIQNGVSCPRVSNSCLWMD